MKTYNYSEAKESFEKYPYFVAPAVAALDTATPDERRELVRRIAAAVCSEADLRSVIGMDPADFADFYPDLRHRDVTTEDTIDTFLEKFSTPEKCAAPQVESIVAAPAIDYAAMMLEDDDPIPAATGEDSTSSMIDSFLKAVPPKTVRKKAQEPKTQEPVPEQPDSPAADTESAEAASSDSLSESLAKMMVKNGNYRKALEIISDLSLKNPKKSIYFADQIRFLKKLIQNQQRSEAGNR